MHKLASLISGVQLVHKPHTGSLELKLHKWKTDHQSSFGSADQSDNPHHQSSFSSQISIAHLSMHKVALNKLIAAF